MNAMTEPLVERKLVEFTLDGQKISAFEDQTLIEIAKEHGKEIPHLCYKPGYRPDGNCRACVVEIKGERTLAPSCAVIHRTTWKSPPIPSVQFIRKNWCWNC